ncbi:MAG: FCD domain-containing protein [Burkholderiaceae bacterium]|nr:FCD domain-containing protein [Burkholderiaceae bacterium]
MDPSHALRSSILDHLHSGQWRAGERLPTERAFSEQFGVGRGSVRKVLLELRDLGLIRQAVGSGTYVTPEAAALVKGLMDAGVDSRQTSPAELMQARLALEPAILELVMGNATTVDFEQMENCCDKAEAATSVEEFELWDGLLHEVIAQAAHNSFVAHVFKLMSQARAQGEWGMLKKRSLTPERRLAYQAEHRRLVQAIKNRDPVQAKALATDHLLHVRRNLLGF